MCNKHNGMMSKAVAAPVDKVAAYKILCYDILATDCYLNAYVVYL